MRIKLNKIKRNPISRERKKVKGHRYLKLGSIDENPSNLILQCNNGPVEKQSGRLTGDKQSVVMLK